MVELSILIPSLNVVSYIGKCVNSISRKVLDNCEIIVIDAMSVDGTVDVIKLLAVDDKRIRLIQSDVRSYGYQMNMGLKAARGKYIFVVESDDMINSMALRNLIKYMEEKPEVDFVKGYALPFFDLFQGGEFEGITARIGKDRNISNKIVCPAETPDLLFQDIYFWVGIYRKEFLDNVFFNETPGAAFQDQGFLLQTLSSSKRAMYVDIPVYRYRQNNPGSSIYNPKGFSYILQEYGLNERFLPNLSSDWKHFFYLRMLQQTLARFQVMGLSGKFWEEAVAALQEIKVRLSDAIEDGLLQVNRFNDEQRIFWDEFQQDIRQPFLHFAGQYVEKKRNFAEIVEWARGHKVVVYGAGNWGRFIQAFLLIHHLGDLQCFADQSEKLQGTEVQGTIVRSPEEALRLHADAHYLIANSRHREEIREYLMRGGVPEEHILSPQITIDTMMFLADFTKEES